MGGMSHATDGQSKRDEVQPTSPEVRLISSDGDRRMREYYAAVGRRLLEQLRR